MAWTPVVGTSVGSSDGGTVSTPPINTIGVDFLGVAVASQPTQPEPTLTCNNGNEFTPLTSRTNSSQVRITLYYCKNPTVSSGHIFTATCANSAYKPSIAVEGFSGGHLTAPFDVGVENGGTNTGTSASTGAISPTQNDELILSAAGWDANSATASVDSGLTITNQTDYSGFNKGVALAHKIQTTAAPITAGWAFTNSEYIAVEAASFKVASGGAADTALVGSASVAVTTYSTLGGVAGSSYTSTQNGNWSNPATWGGVGVPGSGDSAHGIHAITGDIDVTVDTLTLDSPGNLTMSPGKKFMPRVQVVQGDALVTISDGAEIAADTSAGNVKWLSGTANNQTLCKLIFLGTSGSHCKVRKIGAGFFHFDGGEQGTGAFGNCGGWSVTYTDFSDLGHPSLQFSIRSNDYGLHHRLFLHCTFDNCKTQFGIPTTNWDANSNADWRVEFCKWTNQPAGAMGMRYVFASTGTGVHTFDDNAVGEPLEPVVQNYCMTLGARDVVANRCYFDSVPAMIGQAGCTLADTCFVRYSGNNQTLAQRGGYPASPGRGVGLFADHTDPADRVNGVNRVGNCHYIQGSGSGFFENLYFEYPHDTSLIDQGDGAYGQEDGQFAGSVIRGCLIVPSITDGGCSTNLHPFIHGNNRVSIYHNTIEGRTAQLTFNERNLTGEVDVAECKSNLIAGVALTGNDWGAIGYAVFEPATNCGTDTMTPAGIKNNYVYKGVAADATVPGASKGVRLRQSAPPDGTNIFDDTTGPQFVDPTRNLLTWAVFKGAVGADPGGSHSGSTWKIWKRSACDAVRTLFMGDPTLWVNEARPFIFAGHAPQNAVLENAGHDGLTIGAIDFAAASGALTASASMAVIASGTLGGTSAGRMMLGIG